MIRSDVALRAAFGPLALAGTVLVAACAGERPVADNAAVSQYELVEVATIGGAVDEGPDAFGRVAGIAFVTGGRVAVLDNAYHEVRLFDDSGRFLSRAGREGSGPGEMRGAFGLGVAPDGVLWVRDNSNGRYVRFAVDGDSLRSVAEFNLGEGAQGPGISPSFDASGRLIHLGLAADSATGGATLTRFTYRVDEPVPVGRVTISEPPPDSIGQFPVLVGEGVTRFFYQPFAPTFLHAHADGGHWARSVSSTATVERYDAAGTLLHRVTVAPDRVSLSPGEQARADSSLARDRRAAGRDLPFTVPATKPLLRAIHFDAAGRLWIEHSVPEGAARIADIFDSTGAPHGRVSWLAAIDLRLGTLGDTLVAGVARDELDIQRVVLLRLQPAAAPAPAPTPPPP